MANLHFFVGIFFESEAIFVGLRMGQNNETKLLKLMEIKTSFCSCLFGI